MNYAAVAVKMPAVFLPKRVQHGKRRIGADLLEDKVYLRARKQMAKRSTVAASNRIGD
jgi:hypothetical protein